MDIYKEFLHRLRSCTLQGVYLILHEDVSCKLREFISLLRDIPFKDGLYYTYYGDVKKIVFSFIQYFISTIDQVTIKADKYTNDLSKDDLIDLIEKTSVIHERNQINFAKEFLPVTSPVEKEIYDEIEMKYNAYKEKFKNFRVDLEQLNKKEQIDEFAKSNHFQFSLKKTSETFHFVHIFIGMMVADRLYQIRVSLEEILFRIRNNLQRMQAECDEELNKLRHGLYDMNKEQIIINRSYRRNSVEEAEVKKRIEIMQEKIENYETNIHVSRLEEELSYWEKRVTDFYKCADLLTKLKTEFDMIVIEENTYNTMRVAEKPGPKFSCWENMGENFRKRKQYLNEKIADAAKALLTFFCCRGTNRIYYTDETGLYYVDEYNHRVYYFRHGMDMLHMDCEGNFNEAPKQVYYYDKIGRHILENGEKVYQCAPCTSKYKLDENEQLKKVTKDCGHSEKVNENCRMDIENFVKKIPPQDNNLKLKFPPDSSDYLWRSFGAILPDALHNVALKKPNNPIHFLAHKLLQYKYTSAPEELRRKSKEAECYRADVYKTREEQAVEASKAWKSKQVKHRKPEESDDTFNQAVLEAHLHQNAFINSLNYYF